MKNHLLWRAGRAALLIAAMATAACFPPQSFAQSPIAASVTEVEFGARKMFFMLFLMLGPF